MTEPTPEQQKEWEIKYGKIPEGCYRHRDPEITERFISRLLLITLFIFVLVVAKVFLYG